MTERDVTEPKDEPAAERPSLEQAVRGVANDRAGAGGVTDDGPGAPGGTRGTGGAAEQDQ